MPISATAQLGYQVLWNPGDVGGGCEKTQDAVVDPAAPPFFFGIFALKVRPGAGLSEEEMAPIVESLLNFVCLWLTCFLDAQKSSLCIELRKLPGQRLRKRFRRRMFKRWWPLSKV